MMKKILLLPFLILSLTFTYGQETTWNYPIKPGTKEWGSLENNTEKINVCQIPIEILHSINTEDLLLICLDYPLLPDIYAFNYIVDGFEKFENDFNGFRELICRKDIVDVILKEYSKQSILDYPKDGTIIEIGNYILRYSFMELFISNQQILNKIDTETKKEIIRTFLITRKNRDELIDLHLFIGMKTSYFVIGNIIYYNLKNDKKNECLEVLNFLEKGGFPSPDIIERLDEATNNYING